MKKISMLKKSLVFASVIIALGATTAFAAHHPNMQNSHNTMNKQMLMHHNNYKTSPTMTLAKLANKPVESVIKECKMHYLDSYQYAEKHGFLMRYKVERMMVAKENVKRAVDNGRLDNMKSKKVLAKINYNISNEKPELTAVYCKMLMKKPMKQGSHPNMKKDMKQNMMHKDMMHQAMKKNMMHQNEGRYFDFKYHDNFGANVINIDE